MKSRRKGDSKITIDIVAVGFAIALVIIVAGMFLAKIDFSMACDFGDIEYVELENATCGYGFSNDYCPLPKTIKCDVSGSAPYLIVRNLLE